MVDSRSAIRASVLVVDDQRDYASILERLLTPKGFDVTSVFNGETALQSICDSPPDVVLLDLMMPGIGGIAVLEALKKNPRYIHIPVIILTGLSERAANVRAVELGADDFLTKPIDAVLLEARIRSSVKLKRLHDQSEAYRIQLEEQNRFLEERVRERTKQIERIRQVTVFSLAKLAESRDTETGAHLERMRSYARELAREIAGNGKYGGKLGDDFADRIFQSSPLHDIGKVGIPDRILLKPGKLDEREFDIIKEHTIIGGDTLRAADIEAGSNSFLAMGRDIAYHHHERWDGTGYPAGLVGEAIPLEARIVALGDVYDALSSKRPYKDAIDHDTSIEMIREGRGSHFDPYLLDAFLAIQGRVRGIRESFHDAGRVSPIQFLLNQLGVTDCAAAPAAADPIEN